MVVVLVLLDSKQARRNWVNQLYFSKKDKKNLELSCLAKQGKWNLNKANKDMQPFEKLVTQTKIVLVHGTM